MQLALRVGTARVRFIHSDFFYVSNLEMGPARSLEPSEGLLPLGIVQRRLRLNFSALYYHLF